MSENNQNNEKTAGQGGRVDAIVIQPIFDIQYEAAYGVTRNLFDTTELKNSIENNLFLKILRIDLVEKKQYPSKIIKRLKDIDDKFSNSDLLNLVAV